MADNDDVESLSSSNSETMALKKNSGDNTSNKKLPRNISEKLRRDRQNFLIQELAKEVPIIAYSQKKLDKSSILRLTVAYLKLHFGIKKMKKAEGSWKPDSKNTNNWGQLLHNAVDGFMIVVSKKGTIILLTESIDHLLGHNQFDLIGKDIYSIIHPDDVKVFQAQFLPRNYSDTYPDSGLSARSFYVRFLNMNSRDTARYTMIHIVGQLQELAHSTRDSNNVSDSDIWLNGVGKVLQNEVVRNISYLDAVNTEWVSQHAMDGQILYTDPRSCQVTGLMPRENNGSSVYIHIAPEDLHMVGRRHQQLLTDGEAPSTIFRLKAYDNITFVEARSSIARDSWTHQPKFIVSLNTVLGAEEGQEKLNKQIQDHPAANAAQTEEIMSDVIKKASMINDIYSENSNDTPFASTSHGDVIKAMNGDNRCFVNSSEYLLEISGNHRKRPLEEQCELNDKFPLQSKVDDFPEIEDIQVSYLNRPNADCQPNQSVNSAYGTDSTDSTTSQFHDKLQNVTDEVHNNAHYSRSYDIPLQRNICVQDQHNQTAPSAPGISHDSQTFFYSSPEEISDYQTSPSDASVTQLSDASSPAKSVMHLQEEKPSNSYDVFQIFSNQLQQKHTDIEKCLFLQSAEITRLESVLANSSHQQESQHYQNMQQRLQLIKKHQSMMESELDLLKKKASITSENLPHSTNSFIEPASPATSFISTGSSEDSSDVSNHKTPRNTKAHLKSYPQASYHTPENLSSDGFRKLTSEDRINQIKTALGRLPVPKLSCPPPSDKTDSGSDD